MRLTNLIYDFLRNNGAVERGKINVNGEELPVKWEKDTNGNAVLGTSRMEKKERLKGEVTLSAGDGDWVEFDGSRNLNMSDVRYYSFGAIVDDDATFTISVVNRDGADSEVIKWETLVEEDEEDDAISGIIIPKTDSTRIWVRNNGSDERTFTVYLYISR